MELTSAVGLMNWEQLQDSPLVLDLIRSWAAWLREGGMREAEEAAGCGVAQEDARPRARWERQHVWGGLKTVVVDVLAADALEAAALQCPELAEAVLAAAAAPPAAVPPRERTHALHCLPPLLGVLKGGAWGAPGGGAGDAVQGVPGVSPRHVIDACCAATWAHVGDVILLKALVEALPPVALTAAAAAACGGPVAVADAGAALAAAVRHLLVTVPGSSVPPLVQGLAIESGLRLVADAGPAARAATAGLWAWRAAAAAGAPAADGGGGDGAATAVLHPGMRERVEEAAADLLVAALEVG
jgi:hypothetical protein